MKHHLFVLVASTVAASMLTLSSQVLAKQYYKWVDSKGSTHYTTTPPPKNAKQQGKLETYGWNNSAPYQPAAAEKSSTPQNVTPENAAPNTQPQQNAAQPEKAAPTATDNTAQPAI